MTPARTMVPSHAETAFGFVDELEQAIAFHPHGCSQRGLTPAVQRRNLFAPGKKALINDVEWGVKGPFRFLLGKSPVQCPCPHALSPESAKNAACEGFAAKVWAKVAIPPHADHLYPRRSQEADFHSTAQSMGIVAIADEVLDCLS
jgi:hypothetical protein